MPPRQRMLIASDPHETRVAVLDRERLVELAIERSRQRGIVGNIYKGRVSRILPGIQAAFVDIGLDRDAFLFVGDMWTGGGGDEPVAAGDDSARQAEAGAASPSIEDLLKGGQEVIVQVVKDPQPHKGARLTTQLSIPGRHLVLLPDGTDHGISRRIEDEAERDRLRRLLDEMPVTGGSLIVRTVGGGKSLQELDRERAYLERTWERIRHRAEKVGTPSLLHRESDLALRVLRDRLDETISEVLVEGEEVFARVRAFLDEIQPAVVDTLRLYQDDPPLFERFGVEEEIDKLLRSRAWLKSGGYLIINPTEALVAIDVNTGRNVGRDDLDQTILRTNLEAVEEAVRQIRLRDLGGIIVLDLIDMTDDDHRRQVLEVLERELSKDRARSRMLNISEFGLVEITRKRSRTNLQALLTSPCPRCGGDGRIKSTTTVCLDLRRALLRRRHLAAAGEVVVRVHPEISRGLQEEESSVLEEIEQTLGLQVVLASDANLHQEQFEILEG